MVQEDLNMLNFSGNQAHMLDSVMLAHSLLLDTVLMPRQSHLQNTQSHHQNLLLPML
jgi:hypothetical protein